MVTHAGIVKCRYMQTDHNFKQIKQYYNVNLLKTSPSTILGRGLWDTRVITKSGCLQRVNADLTYNVHILFP